MKYNKLNRKAIGCMYVSTAIASAIFAAIVIGIYFLSRDEVPLEYIGLAKLIVTALVIVIVFNVIFSPIIRYRRYRYLIDNEKVEIITGLLFITREIVPIERLHKITIEKGPIDRMFGLGKVIVTTAGGIATIRFLEEIKAEEIAEHLKNKINQIIINERSYIENGEENV